jgi:Flp pilus assembly pilin Flp
MDKSQRGATMIEYALIVALIAVAVFAIEDSIGSSTYNAIRGAANSIDSAGSPL